MPEEFVPPVVAVVVVTGEAGQSLEECLEALALQDYPALEVLVVDASVGDGVANRVAEVLPGAFVRRAEAGLGFPAAANEALSGVEGASFFLFCSPECALAEGALRSLVQEAFRSNASLVGPKLVDWNRPDRLAEVGLGVDRNGAAVSRVEEGELDQAQHDEVREVFAVPVAGLLARADVLETLGGFDVDMAAGGEDVDLCWRAHLAGARVVVAPQACVRFLRQPIALRRQPARLAATRAAQLRAARKNYGWLRGFLALLRFVALMVLDSVLAPLTGSGERARARRAAWRWHVAHRRSVRRLRALNRGIRQVSDRTVVSLMSKRGLFRRVTRPASAHAAGGRWAGVGSRNRSPLALPANTGSAGAAVGRRTARAGALAPESDRLTDLVVRLQHGEVATGQAVAVVIGIFLWLVAVRGLLFGALPTLGQLVPGPTGWRLAGQYFGGLAEPGWRATQAASPAYLLVGLLAGLLGNSYWLAIKLVYLGGLVAGAFGVGRLVRGLGTGRARIAAGLAFAASPLVWNSLAHGNLQASVALGASPYVLARLARAFGLGDSQRRDAAEAGRAFGVRTLLGEIAPFGLLLAVTLSLAPAFAVDVALLVVVFALLALIVPGSLGRLGLVRGAVVSLLAAGVAWCCCLPWSLTWFMSSSSLSQSTGVPLAPGQGLDPAQLLRGFTGPVGHFWGAFGLAAASLGVLLWGRRPRLDWGVRWLVTALAVVALAWLGSSGRLGAGFGQTDVILAPLVACVAACCGAALASFETDLGQHRFGWRQLSGLLVAGCALVGIAPALGVLANGRSDLPGQGYEQAAGELSPAAGQTFRVLWVGDPRSIPGASWQISRGVAASVTLSGVPSFSDLYAPFDPGPGRQVASDLLLAEAHKTLQLGALLARYGVHDIVIPTGQAPVLPGEQNAPRAILPPGLIAALQTQNDLMQLPEEAGIVVFENTRWTPADGAGALVVPARSGSFRGLGVALAMLVAAAAVLEGVQRRRKARHMRPGQAVGGSRRRRKGGPSEPSEPAGAGGAAEAVAAGEVDAGDVDAGDVEADEVEAVEVEAVEVEAGDVVAGDVVADVASPGGSTGDDRAAVGEPAP
jgi:GT2 family glycosyltransferase